jgi:hypothetical protein
VARDRVHARGSLGALFGRLAERAGHGDNWRAFVAGSLAAGGPPFDRVDAIAAEPVPASRTACEALAARHGLDGWLLWALVERYGGEEPPEQP